MERRMSTAEEQCNNSEVIKANETEGSAAVPHRAAPRPRKLCQRAGTAGGQALVQRLGVVTLTLCEAEDGKGCGRHND